MHQPYFPACFDKRAADPQDPKAHANDSQSRSKWRGDNGSSV
jgi:hypothetical protein